MLTKPGSGEASRKRVDEAGGGRPPAGVAGRWPLHLRALLSPSLELVGLYLEFMSRAGVNVISLMVRNRERLFGVGGCLPVSSLPLSGFILHAFPSDRRIELKFDLKSLHFEFCHPGWATGFQLSPLLAVSGGSNEDGGGESKSMARWPWQGRET